MHNFYIKACAVAQTEIKNNGCRGAVLRFCWRCSCCVRLRFQLKCNYWDGAGRAVVGFNDFRRKRAVKSVNARSRVVLLKSINFACQPIMCVRALREAYHAALGTTDQRWPLPWWAPAARKRWSASRTGRRHHPLGLYILAQFFFKRHAIFGHFYFINTQHTWQSYSFFPTSASINHSCIIHIFYSVMHFKVFFSLSLQINQKNPFKSSKSPHQYLEFRVQKIWSVFAKNL